MKPQAYRPNRTNDVLLAVLYFVSDAVPWLAVGVLFVFALVLLMGGS
jgi:hypothetical protein